MLRLRTRFKMIDHNDRSITKHGNLIRDGPIKEPTAEVMSPLRTIPRIRRQSKKSDGPLDGIQSSGSSHEKLVMSILV